jgi:hypothetical protein
VYIAQLTLIDEGPYIGYTWGIVLIGDERIRARASSLITFLMTIAIDIHILDDSPRYREYSKYYLENKFM